jgi:hypothetical protein
MTESRQPDPERRRLARSIFELSPLDDVAEAVAVATKDETRLYVERIGNFYRWSLIHPGGAYPLLRIAARFLQVDYHRIVIGLRAVAEGDCVLSTDPDNAEAPDAWAVIEFDGPADPTEVKERIAQALESTSQ